jgi:hypothetical protein
VGVFLIAHWECAFVADDEMQVSAAENANQVFGQWRAFL